MHEIQLIQSGYLVVVRAVRLIIFNNSYSDDLNARFSSFNFAYPIIILVWINLEWFYSKLITFYIYFLTTRLAHNIFAVGIMDKLSLRWNGHRRPCETTGIQAISLHQTSFVFILLGLSMIVGALVLCIEALYQGFSTRSKGTRKPKR